MNDVKWIQITIARNNLGPLADDASGVERYRSAVQHRLDDMYKDAQIVEVYLSKPRETRDRDEVIVRGYEAEREIEATVRGVAHEVFDRAAY